MGVQTSINTFGTWARHLVMAYMCLAPQNIYILTAQIPQIESYTTFLNPIFFVHPVLSFVFIYISRCTNVCACVYK